MQSNDAKQIAEGKDLLEKSAKNAFSIRNLETEEQKRKALVDLAEEAASQGHDVSQYSKMINLSPAELDLELQKQIIMVEDANKLAELTLEQLQPQTQTAKLKQDFDNGFINEETFQQQTAGDRFKNIKVDDNGNFFGINQEGIVEQIPFAEGSAQFRPNENGTSLQVGADGSVSFATGGAQPAQVDTQGLTQPNQNEQQQQLINARAGLSRLQAIQNSFNPEFLTAGSKFNNLITNTIKSKINPENLSAEQRQELEDFSRFRADSVRNLNNYIKEITGAQISPEEADRLISGLPNAGTKTGLTGILEGDDAITFKGKLDSITSELKLAIARSSLNLGFGVPLENVKSEVANRAQQIETNLRSTNPNLSDDQVRQIVQAEVRQLIGF